ALSRAFKDRDHEKVTHPTGGLIFAMVVNFLMSTVVNILIDIHKRTRFQLPAFLGLCLRIDPLTLTVRRPLTSCFSL
ncbi:hypothetical protein M4D70_02405, partial [Brevibacillus borstelensis]|uniref:hypothetical protein n=1 Tax=Brevibacillus borstelensis TaxID=45462 RepID=UPI0020415BEA